LALEQLQALPQRQVLWQLQVSPQRQRSAALAAQAHFDCWHRHWL